MNEPCSGTLALSPAPMCEKPIVARPSMSLGSSAFQLRCVPLSSSSSLLFVLTATLVSGCLCSVVVVVVVVGGVVVVGVVVVGVVVVVVVGVVVVGVVVVGVVFGVVVVVVGVVVVVVVGVVFGVVVVVVVVVGGVFGGEPPLPAQASACVISCSVSP